MPATSSPVTPAALLTVLANAAAVAVAFGVPLTHSQIEILLAFVGSVTSLIFSIVAAVHVHHVNAAVKLAAPTSPSSPQAASASPTPSPSGGGG